MIEILAPAGDFECLRAGVLNGANAVYIGGKEFSARQFAGNFDREEMIEAIRFCHSYGVKVYVTMNTLYNNEELSGALSYAAFLYENGVDAVIIQDIGFMKLLREKLPQLNLHASTQMTVHNLSGAELLYEMGIKRVVLARELTLSEIKYIVANTKAEIEVFVHGALCISFSGQCLFSSMIGGRSGNRGRCAQSCRQEYNFENGAKGYFLSPKDLSTLEFIKDIENAGVTSIKIEGRMKKPEYVSGVVSSYKRALAGKLTPQDVEKVTQLFNRGGFTSYNLIKRPGSEMMSYKRPKNWGMKLGTVIKANNKFATIKLVRELNVGDGVENWNRDNGALVSKMWKDGAVVEHGEKEHIVEIYLEKAVKGDEIYKSLDVKLVNIEENSYKGKNVLQMPLIGKFIARLNENIKLEIKNVNGISATVLGKVPELALRTSVSEDMIRKALLKTKDTSFYFKELNIELEDGLSIPVSELNLLRRSAITGIIDKLQKKREKIGVEVALKNNNKNASPKLVCITGDLECAKGAIDSGCDMVFFGGDNLRTNKGTLDEVIEFSNGRAEIMPAIPEIVLEEYENKLSYLNKLDALGLHSMLCGNMGILSETKNSNRKVFLSSGFNLFNSPACEMFENTVATVSKELNFKQIRDLIAKTKAETMVTIHGRTKVMVSRHCFIGSIRGHGRENCPVLCENRSHYLTDKMNESFKIVPDNLCRNHIYNSKILCTLEHMKDIINLKADYLALEFVDESYDETRRIVSAYKQQLAAGFEGVFGLLDDSAAVLRSLEGKITKGHFNRGVE